jgi:hypothetical protein
MESTKRIDNESGNNVKRYIGGKIRMKTNNKAICSSALLRL